MTASGRPRLAIISSQAFSLHNFRGPLMRAFVDRGVDVVALASDYDDVNRAAVAATGARPVDFSLSRAGMNPVSDALNTVRLTRLLRALRPDMTLSYFIKPVIYGTLSAAAAGVPRRYALVPGLGSLFTDTGDAIRLPRRAMRTVAARLYGMAFARCERVFLQNHDDADWFVRRGLLDGGKVVVTRGTGIDLDRWTPVPLPAPPVTFLLVARLLREKGIIEYADAARQLKRRHPAARFLLVGGLDENPSSLTREDVRAWVDAGILEWTGPVTDVRPYIAQSHVYVLPSFYREGIPRSIQEAMAMGRAVITTDNVGCRETVDEGTNGYLVPVRDAQALAAAMERFIARPELAAHMGRESRRLAEERFDVHRTNAAILHAMGL